MLARSTKIRLGGVLIALAVFIVSAATSAPPADMACQHNKVCWDDIIYGGCVGCGGCYQSCDDGPFCLSVCCEGCL